jgi:hypothetical protein
MSVRAASSLLMIGLLSLGGCVEQPMKMQNFTSAELVTGSDAGQRPLSSTQLAALSDWVKTGEAWSGFTADIPDHASMEVDMQEADGQSDKLMIYQRDDGSATAYLYHAQRLAPVRRHLSGTDLTALQSIVNGQ